MKKFLSALIILTVLATAGYYLYYTYLRAEDRSLWSYVPDNALAVYEVQNFTEVWNLIKSRKLNSSLDQIGAFADFDEELVLLDSLSGKNGSLGSLLGGKLLISYHILSKATIGPVYYLKLDNGEKRDVAALLLERFKSGDSRTYRTRQYNGFTIHEITASNTTFSWILNQNALILSFKPFLIEDVIRVIENSDEEFQTHFQQLQEFPKLSNDQGNFYVNLEDFRLFISVFLQKGIKDSSPLANLGNGGFFDVSINDQNILLNGFCDVAEDDFLSVFDGQQPVQSSLKYYIPNSAIDWVEYNFTDWMRFRTNVKKYWKKVDEKYDNVNREKLSTFGLEDAFASWMGNTVGLARFEGNPDTDDFIVYLHTSDPNEALNEINSLTERIARSNGDSVYIEPYSTYEIRELELNQFAHDFVLPVLPRSEETYFMLVNDYLLISNSVQNLKSFVVAQESESTWGRSVNYNRFVDNTMEESNMAYYFNTTQAWNAFKSIANEEWQGFINADGNILKNFGLGAVEFARLDESFYASVVINHEARTRGREENTGYKVAMSQATNYPIISRPFVVRNYMTSQLEIGIQDSLLNYGQYTSSGDMQFAIPLNGPIVNDISQVDYFNNGKLQNFMITDKSMYIIDRLGNLVEGFPVKMQTSTPEFARVIDYDKSKRYRFLIADDRGDLYLYNKEGVLLGGWNPKSLGYPLAIEPFHLRVRKKDCFVALLQNGTFVIMNRRGETLPGFPLTMNERFDGEVYVTMGSDFKTTTLTSVSREGTLVRLNLEGELLSSSQLFKPTPDSRFFLVPDALGKGFVVVRKDLNRLVFLSESQNELFAKDYLGADDFVVQYYDFNLEHKLYAVTDKVQGFTYLYDKSGNLINNRPVDSNFEIGVLFSEVNNEYRIYVATEDAFKIIEFK